MVRTAATTPRAARKVKRLTYLGSSDSEASLATQGNPVKPFTLLLVHMVKKSGVMVSGSVLPAQKVETWSSMPVHTLYASCNGENRLSSLAMKRNRNHTAKESYSENVLISTT